MTLKGRIRSFRSRFTRRAFRRVERLPKRSALPQPLDRGTVYVVGEPEQWLVFLCPCRRGHDIALSVGDGGPWRLTSKRWRPPSVRPSVNAEASGRRCHFWVVDGRIRWCADSDTAPRWSSDWLQ